MMNITIYTSNHCRSCHIVMDFLDQQQIAYRELKIDSNQTHFEEMLALGGIATPFLVINDVTSHSFDAEKIMEVLGKRHE
jgi:glutaredoxin